MPTVLDSIIEGVVEDMRQRQEQVPLAELKERAAAQPPAIDAFARLSGATDDTVQLICEVKRSSPSKGELAAIADPADLAARYETGGATAISVLTEQRRFKGSLADLTAVRQRVSIPVLRKDFTVDEYQIWEARAYGADLVLLIVAALDDDTLKRFLELTHELGMNALVETHTVEEVERARTAGARIIGVNVRNLKTLDVDNSHFARLAEHLPSGVVIVAESGVAGPQDVADYASHGAQAVLVGEALVTSGDPTAAVASFAQAGSTARQKYLSRIQS